MGFCVYRLCHGTAFFSNGLDQAERPVKKLIDKTVIYLSDNDPYIPATIVDNFEELRADIVTLQNRGHFNKSAGILDFPEILKEFSSVGGGWVPVPEKDLPLELPKVKHYEPSGTGESPLANIDKWVNTKCPVCGGPAKRETNTMPQWAGSCWYFLAFAFWGGVKLPTRTLLVG